MSLFNCAKFMILYRAVPYEGDCESEGCTMIKNKFIVPIATWIVITLSLYLSIIVKSRTPFAVPLLLAYIGIGLIGFLYSLLLRVLKMPLGSTVFFFLSLASGLYLFFGMPKGSDGLSELATFLGWLVLMGGSIVVALIIGLIQRFRKR